MTPLLTEEVMVFYVTPFHHTLAIQHTIKIKLNSYS